MMKFPCAQNLPERSINDSNTIIPENTGIRKRRLLSLRTFALLVISIILIILLLNQISIRDTLNAFKNVDPLLLITACCIYFLSNYFKSMRYNVMLREYSIKPFDMYVITGYQNFFNQILPARTGELTLIYYLKKVAGAEIPKGLHVLLVTRIYDFIIVTVFFIISLIIYYGKNVSQTLLILGIVLLLFSVICLFSLKWAACISYALFNAIVNCLDLNKRSAIIKLKRGFETIVSEFSDYRIMRQMPALIITSSLIWILLYALAYITILAFDVKIGIVQSVIGSTGHVIANVLPVNSFGSIGTLEAGWAGGFLLLGMAPQDAITTGFGYHIINFMASMIIALVCYLIMKIKGKTKSGIADKSSNIIDRNKI